MIFTRIVSRMPDAKPSRLSHTRKNRATPSTLPHLRMLFNQLRKSSAEIIRSTPNTKDRIRKFKQVWKELFHHPVDPMAADAYLRIIEKGGKARLNKTRRLRQKQRGGSAPVDFQTRPGVDGVHGSFPQYLTGGLSFYDTINQQGMFKGCGVENSTPVVPHSIGSGGILSGGGGVLTSLSDAITVATTRPDPSAVPATVVQDAVSAWQGQPLGASPQASSNPLPYRT